jgi:type VI secretion system protein ImpF
MARSDADLTVTQSLVDRLTDDKPHLAADPSMTRAQSVRELKKALRRDLEWLLNTRRNPEPAGEDMQELAASLYNYGLPDFSAYSLGSPRDRSRLILELENCVALFEPRLREVRVSVVEAPSVANRSLHFQIEGMLQMDPAPEQVSFDTVLQLTSGEYQIRGERSA